MGIIDTSNTASATSWHRRLDEVAALSGLLLMSMWLLAKLVSDPLVSSLSPPLYAVIPASILVAVSAAGIVLSHHKSSRWLSYTAALLLSLSTLLALIGTNGIHSPYIMLWMLAGSFAALFGARSLIPTGAMVVAILSYMALNGEIKGFEWLIFGFVFILPLVFSCIVWGVSTRTTSKDEKVEEVSALAAELNQESNKSGIIVNAIADGVIVTDAQGVIQLINPAALSIVGWGKEDAAKLDYRSVLKIIDSKDTLVNETIDPIQQCLKTNRPVLTDRFGVRTVSGKKLLASIMASPLGVPGRGAVIIFRDITATRAEEREQAEFISTASHEMRTPVASIEGYLGLALNPQTAGIDDRARSYLTKAHEAAQHLGRLFQDLLDISRAEDGRLNTNEIVVDIAQCSRQIITDFLETAREKSLALIFAPDNRQNSSLDPIFYTRIDIDQYREVFANLIENAIKYTREGSITIDIKGTDERVLVSVADNGIGIPAEDIPHLFQKFYRVDNSDTREIGGTGLGLYLSRRLTENMGGQLSVDSEYGKGSTFTIELPRISQDQAETELRSLKPVSTNSGYPSAAKSLQGTQSTTLSEIENSVKQ